MHRNYAIWFERVPKKHFVLITGVIAFVGAVSFVASASAISQTQKYINHGFRPASCNMPLQGLHRCNLVVPVDKSGNPMHAATFYGAELLRHLDAAKAPKFQKSFTGVFTPQQIHTAYQLPCAPGGPVQGTCAQPANLFGPNTIAIVDAGGYRGPGSIEGNLATFDQQYDLPTCTQANGCLKIVNGSGQTSPLPPPLPLNDNWDIEYDLDVQTAHMICQTCKILVVEAADDGESLDQAVPVAASFRPVAISLSWGGSNESSDNADFQFQGIAVVGASGDFGSDEANDYPADLADVIAAAGTTLTLNSNNSWQSETVWSDSGGGCAMIGFDAPTWQTSLSNWNPAGCGLQKADGDMSALADPIPGVAVYSDGQWLFGGGTSLAAPLIAGSIALSGRVPTDEYGSQYLYQNADGSDTHDITQGSDCTPQIVTHCTAGTGFDEPSGLGSLTGLGLFGGFHDAPSGDFNGDGKVNITDLSTLLSHFNTSGDTVSQGDLNGDGSVNVTDLSIFLRDWTG